MFFYVFHIFQEKKKAHDLGIKVHEDEAEKQRLKAEMDRKVVNNPSTLSDEALEQFTRPGILIIFSFLGASHYSIPSILSCRKSSMTSLSRSV